MKRPIIGVVTGLAILGVSASAVGQSLAEVARKEQERRKAVKEPGKVYTNDTIAASPAPPSPEPAPARSDTAKAQDTDKAEKKAEEKPTTGEVRDEKYWRSRITAARMQLERNNIFLEALQSRVNALTNDFTARDDPAQRALIGEDRQRALAEMERVRLEVENLKKEIAAIEEEARRENVPPGWLR